MVLALSKRVLDQIYNNNKAKLCEIRIRLMGTEVTLNHVIDHPRGADLFLQYLEKEHAAENLQFYCAVDKFDAMCRELKKQYLYLLKVREEHAAANQDTVKQQVGEYFASFLSSFFVSRCTSATVGPQN